MVSGVMDGKPMDEATVACVRRVTRGQRTTVYAGPQMLMEFDFTFDATKSPRTIDYSHTAGAKVSRRRAKRLAPRHPERKV